MERMRSRWRGCDADIEDAMQMERMRCRWRGCDPDGEGAMQMEGV